MFTLIQCTPTRGDCIAGYEVDLDKDRSLSMLFLLTKKMSGEKLK